MVKLSDLGARYGMTPAAFERLLVEVGWMKDGELRGAAAVYVTDGAVTARGLGVLDGYLGRR